MVAYSDVGMTDPGDSWEGIGNINKDPLFADPDYRDYHLKSVPGRWNPIFQTNGDFNGDGIINFPDFAMFAWFWRDTGVGIPVDLHPDNSIDFNDVKEFVSSWLAPGQNIGGWVFDDVNSPCIDAGDPNSDYSSEPTPNGARINMGAYGNTIYASKSGQAQQVAPDLDGYGNVDFYDFAIFAGSWRLEGPGMPQDFFSDDVIDEKDLFEFTKWWLWHK